MQDIDAAYMFQDIGDIDDDLSSLLVPDLDFSGLNDMYTPSVKKPPPVQTGEKPCCTFCAVQCAHKLHLFLSTRPLVVGTRLSELACTRP